MNGSGSDSRNVSDSNPSRFESVTSRITSFGGSSALCFAVIVANEGSVRRGGASSERRGTTGLERVDAAAALPERLRSRYASIDRFTARIGVFPSRESPESGDADASASETSSTDAADPRASFAGSSDDGGDAAEGAVGRGTGLGSLPGDATACAPPRRCRVSISRATASRTRRSTASNSDRVASTAAANTSPFAPPSARGGGSSRRGDARFPGSGATENAPSPAARPAIPAEDACV